MITIVTSAIKNADGKMYFHPGPGPKRHCDVIQMMGLTLPWPVTKGATQGFMTSDGRFVGRIEAAELAIAAGQLTREQLQVPPELYSEDLWKGNLNL